MRGNNKKPNALAGIYSTCISMGVVWNIEVYK